MSNTSLPEKLLCDTSFVGHLGKRLVKPERYGDWEREKVERIDSAILAISVVTLAEARAGYLNAGWGQRKIDAEERRLGSFLRIPLDWPDLDEWARLKNQARKWGWQMSDNDIWIASVASTRDIPLVTCDKDQSRLDPDLPIEVIHLPV